MADGFEFNARQVIDVNSNMNDRVSVSITNEKELSSLIRALEKAKQGFNIHEYFQEEADLIERTTKAAEAYRSSGGRKDATEFFKSFSSLKATMGDSISSFTSGIDEFDSLLRSASSSVPAEIKTIFDPSDLQEYFHAFEVLQSLLGKNFGGIFSSLSSGVQTVGKMSSQIRDLSNALESARDEITSLKSTNGIDQLEEARRKLEQISEIGSKELSASLRAYGFSGDDVESWGMFSEYFDSVESGAETSSEALGKIKHDFSYLFEKFNTGGGSGTVGITGGLEETERLLGSIDDKLLHLMMGVGNLGVSVKDIFAAVTEVDDAPQTIRAIDTQIQSLVSTIEQLGGALDEIKNRPAGVIQNVFGFGGSGTDQGELNLVKKQAQAYVDQFSELARIINSNPWDKNLNQGVLRASKNESVDLFGLITGFDSSKASSDVISKDSLSAVEAITARYEHLGDVLRKIVETANSRGSSYLLPGLEDITEATDALEQYRSAQSGGGSGGVSFDNLPSDVERIADAITGSDGLSTIKSQLDSIVNGIANGANNGGGGNGRGGGGGSGGGNAGNYYEYSRQIREYFKAYNQVTKAQLTSDLSGAMGLGWDAGNSGLKQSVKILNELEPDFVNLRNALLDSSRSVEEIANDLDISEDQVARLRDSINDKANANAMAFDKASLGAINIMDKDVDKLKDLVNDLRSTGVRNKTTLPALEKAEEILGRGKDWLSDPANSKEVRDARIALRQIAAANHELTDTPWAKLVKSLGNQARALLGGMTVGKIRQLLTQVYSNVVRIDSAMGQLRIVTGATDAEMSRFLSNASSMAKELGTNITNVLNVIETFSRLGYNLSESSTLAEFTSILSNVAGVSTQQSTTGITSIIKGFDLDVSQTEHVADVLVQVGQKYAVSAGELMEAYERSSAALAATGTSFEKSAGLIAAANAAVECCRVA